MEKGKSQFLRRLEAALEAKGWTPSDLARAIGATPAMMTRYKHGVMPRLETIHKMAEALELPVSEFISEGKPEEYQGYPPESNLIREEPAPYHVIIRPEHDRQPAPDAAERMLDVTLSEIKSRLEQLRNASTSQREKIKRHIVARVNEFDELCPEPETI